MCEFAFFVSLVDRFKDLECDALKDYTLSISSICGIGIMRNNEQHRSFWNNRSAAHAANENIVSCSSSPAFEFNNNQIEVFIVCYNLFHQSPPKN